MSIKARFFSIEDEPPYWLELENDGHNHITYTSGEYGWEMALFYPTVADLEAIKAACEQGIKALKGEGDEVQAGR